MALQNVSLADNLRRAFNPVVPGNAPFRDGWAAGVLYRGGWTFAVTDETVTDVPGDYAVIAADETKMKRLTLPDDIDEKFASLLAPGTAEDYELGEATVKATIAITGRRPAFAQQRVRPDVVASFLRRYGPLTDSFLRAGEDPVEERQRCSNRDSRGAEWAYRFNDAVAYVANIFDLSRSDPDEALQLAYLLLDEAPQFTLLKSICLNVFTRTLNGRDVTRCANPRCRRYFEHKRADGHGCSDACNAALRLQRFRAKKRPPKGDSNG
jgi:hypothetical protein